MIIFRYLGREVLTSMIAVSAALLLIIMSGRFVKYLADAASGKLQADALLAIMAFRLPGFLELILPLGLFIGFLLAYGRLYTDSELTVMTACGLSQRRLLSYSFFPAGIVALLVALLALVVSPSGISKAESVFKAQKNRSQFDHMVPARFQASADGDAVTYAENLSDDRKSMQGVFIAEMGSGGSEGTDQREGLGIMVAEHGEQVIDPDSGQRYLKLRNGSRYIGNPGEANYQVIDFEYYWQLLPAAEDDSRNKGKSDSRPTRELLGSSRSEDIAALHWRISLPVLVVVVTLLAVPLSKTNPRQGRYVQMIPSILLYIIYLVCLNAARGAVEEGGASPWRTIWAVHGAFLLVALTLFVWPILRRSFNSQRRKRGRANA
ncbi:LPS export ABC transporter permease LptF [Pseudomaricurvus alcaniphilus]|uniref:LPS export ABC transporter permease LptF n=1 Tax=Pseudomaricurvus alcaniphilus TaxID=1166482 RepID=UPI00140ACA13|nr:LPS export ABC transporter permease LptF [Pseudomaricurvus alcaniphilus]